MDRPKCGSREYTKNGSDTAANANNTKITNTATQKSNATMKQPTRQSVKVNNAQEELFTAKVNLTDVKGYFAEWSGHHACSRKP
jgi:hypothetical protein